MCIPNQQYRGSIIQIMKHQKLSEKITSIKSASQYEHKLIDSIYHIMSQKRKAENDYKISLQGINKELQQYVQKQSGFLNQIVRAFQSYINVMYQNQCTLIQGYDTQILSFLIKAKQSSFEQDIMKKVEFVDTKVKECRQKIKQTKRIIKKNEEDLQVISSEVKLKTKIKELTDDDKKKFAEQYSDLTNLKKINQDTLEQHVDGMMDLTMLHNQTLEELDEYQTIYLERKANDVFDNFMRTFVLEVSFIRSMQFDVTAILQKVNDNKDENKRVSIDALRKRMDKDKGIKESIWESYKKWTTPEHDVDISETYVNSRIRDKWKRVCEYYNQAKY